MTHIELINTVFTTALVHTKDCLNITTDYCLLPLESKLHESTDFCLFCSFMYPTLLEECLVDSQSHLLTALMNEQFKIPIFEDLCSSTADEAHYSVFLK